MAAPRLRLIPGGRQDEPQVPRRSRRVVPPPPPRARTRLVGPSLRPVDPDAPRGSGRPRAGVRAWAAVVMGMAGVSLAAMGLPLLGGALLLAGGSVAIAPPGLPGAAGPAPGGRRRLAGAALMGGALVLVLVHLLAA